MTKRERVIRALRHQPVDMAPYHVELTWGEHNKLTDYTGDPAFLDKAGVHLQGYQYGGWPTEQAPGSGMFRDDFGVVWNRSGTDKDIGVVDHPLVTEPDIALFQEPFLNEARLREEIETCLARKKDRFTYLGIGFTLFERFWSYCGMENALVFMLTDPEFTHAVLERICDFNLRVLDVMLEYPSDAIYFGDDWGQQKGLIMGPHLWREFMKPYLARMYRKAKDAGRYVFQHSCGDIHELFPDLIEIGLDCYQTFQPEIYDVAAVKREYGKELSFWGGVSTQRLLPFASPEEVKAESARLIRLLSVNGGYIAAPTHAVPPDVPVENLLAMLDAFQHQV